jgi:hypothetical protein
MMSRKYLFLCLVSLAFVSGLSLRARPSEGFLTKSSVEVASLLSDPPQGGSEEALAELALVRQAVAQRTPSDEKAILEEDRVSAFNYASAIGPEFVPGKFPKVEALMLQVEQSGGPVIREAKQHWNRPRPFMTDPAIKALAEEKSFSYPSGHGTRGILYALVLAELFPEHREALLVRGRAIGWHRVLAGVHYPSDIQAGRVLGLAIFNELMRTDGFRKALAEAKAEVESGAVAAK